MLPKGKWGVAYTVEIPLIDAGTVNYAASGDVTLASGDVKVIKDGGSPANIGTLPSAVVSGNGSYWTLSLSATEMQCVSRVAVTIIDAATKAVEDQMAIIEMDYGVRSNTAQAGANTSITLDASASSTADFYRGLAVELIGGTGVGQFRIITAYDGTSKEATVHRAWAVNPDSTSIFRLKDCLEADVASWLGSAPNALASGRVPADAQAISGDSTAADNLETMLDGTGGQTLTLGQLRINSSAAGGGIDIDNSAGPAISAQSSAADALSLVSTGADGHGFYAAGNGGGDGLHALGGATGHGIHGTGGSTSGHGMRVTAPTEGDGLEAAGAGAGKDIDADLSGSVASVVGAVGSVTGNVGGNVTGSVGSVAGNVSGSVASVVGAVGSVTGAVGSVTGNVGGSVASVTDRTGFSLSVAGILAIWDQLRSATFGVGSFGEMFKAWMAALGTDNRPKISADVHTGGATIAAVSGAVGSVTGAVGSVTGNVTGSVGSLATQAKLDVNAEVDTALADINLDHLVKNAVDTDFATTVHLDSVVGYLADNGTTASFSRGSASLEAIRARGDAAWTTGGGAVGSNSVTFTVRNSSTSALLVGVPVNIYASDGTSLVDSETTGAGGTAVFSLDSGAYYYAVPPVAGYGSVAATSLTVDGVETVTISLVPISSASTAPGTRIVRCITRTADGALDPGVVVKAKLLNASTVDQALITRQQLEVTSDANGIADITCITSDQFTGGGDGRYEFTVPNAERVTSAVAAGSGFVYLEDLRNPA